MNNVFDNLVPLLVTAVMPFVLYLLHKLVAVVAAKLHITNITGLDAQIDSLVTTAVQGVEQKAQALVDSNSLVMSSKDKLDAAVSWVNAEMAQLGLAPVPVQQLIMRIESSVFANLNQWTTNIAAGLDKPVPVPAPVPPPTPAPAAPVKQSKSK